MQELPSTYGLKLAGQKWSVTSAQAVANLKCCKHCNAWEHRQENYCDCYLMVLFVIHRPHYEALDFSPFS